MVMNNKTINESHTGYYELICSVPIFATIVIPKGPFTPSDATATATSLAISLRIKCNVVVLFVYTKRQQCICICVNGIACK